MLDLACTTGAGVWQKKHLSGNVMEVSTYICRVVGYLQ